jgi:predicted ester cyclase
LFAVNVNSEKDFQGETTMSAELNKSTAVRFFMEQDRRKGPLDSEICAPEYVAKISSNPPLDLDGHSQFGLAFYAGFPDLYHTIEDTFADGDKVCVRFTVRGTHTGEFLNIPATGRSIQVSAIVMMDFDNGKIKQLHGQFDQVGMMQQLGVVPV